MRLGGGKVERVLDSRSQSSGPEEFLHPPTLPFSTVLSSS